MYLPIALAVPWPFLSFYASNAASGVGFIELAKYALGCLVVVGAGTWILMLILPRRWQAPVSVFVSTAFLMLFSYGQIAELFRSFSIDAVKLQMVA